MGFPDNKQNHIQPVEVADLLGNVIADHGCGLGVILGQHLSHFDQPCQVSCLCGAVLHRLRVQDMDARGPRVKVNSIAAITDHRFAPAVVKFELGRDCF